MVLASTWITDQLVFDGFVSGLVIGLLAMGIVLIYRATRVINFAVGNMGPVGASLLALLVAGEGTFTVGDEVHVLGPGDAIAFTPATPHQWENRGVDPAQVVIVTRRILP